MVTNRKEHGKKTPANQGPEEASSEPNKKINASTPYDSMSKPLVRPVRLEKV